MGRGRIFGNLFSSLRGWSPSTKIVSSQNMSMPNSVTFSVQRGKRTPLGSALADDLDACLGRLSSGRKSVAAAGPPHRDLRLARQQCLQSGVGDQIETIVRPPPMTDFTVPMAALSRSLVVASSRPTVRWVAARSSWVIAGGFGSGDPTAVSTHETPSPPSPLTLWSVVPAPRRSVTRVDRCTVGHRWALRSSRSSATSAAQ